MIAKTFVQTGEYNRFVEFCDACRKYRYIGLCYGPPGVGKTLSARHYTGSDLIERMIPYGSPDSISSERTLDSNSVFYTVNVSNTPLQIERQLDELRQRVTFLSRAAIAIADKRKRLKEEQHQARESTMDWDTLLKMQRGLQKEIDANERNV